MSDIFLRTVPWLGLWALVGLSALAPAPSVEANHDCNEVKYEHYDLNSCTPDGLTYVSRRIMMGTGAYPSPTYSWRSALFDASSGTQIAVIDSLLPNADGPQFTEAQNDPAPELDIVGGQLPPVSMTRVSLHAFERQTGSATPRAAEATLTSLRFTLTTGSTTAAPRPGEKFLPMNSDT